MEKQYKELLKIYKEYINVFNNWETSNNDTLNTYNYIYLARIYQNLTDLLVSNKIIQRHGERFFKIVESEEII